MLADLATPDQVRRAAGEVSDRLRSLDALVANPGVYRAALERTEIGVERTLAVTHLAHFQLVSLLLDRVPAADGRVPWTRSSAERKTLRAGRPMRIPSWPTCCSRSSSGATSPVRA